MKVFGRYTIERELGRGGMATVYLAHDPQLKRDVALKVLPRQFTHDPQFRARFKREAEALSALDHPAIVPVYETGEVDDQPYLVMRYMPGGTLLERMGPSLTRADIVDIVQRVAAALDAAHARGMVHRDLKPSNILFDQLVQAYLADFGVVKMTEATAATTTSMLIGTPAYMSPEQALGKGGIDARSDVYSLGVILFELLAGKLPYEADTPMGLALAHLNDPVPEIASLVADLPKDADAVLNMALAKDRADRFATAGALATATSELLTGRPVRGVTRAARPVARPPVATLVSPRRSRWALAGLVGLILIGLALAVALGSSAAELLAAPATPNVTVITQPAQVATVLVSTTPVPLASTASATSGATVTVSITPSASPSPRVTRAEGATLVNTRPPAAEPATATATVRPAEGAQPTAPPPRPATGTSALPTLTQSVSLTPAPPTTRVPTTQAPPTTRVPTTEAPPTTRVPTTQAPPTTRVPTNTAVSPTLTPVPPTNTAPPTWTPVPPTLTPVPPTSTPEPPTWTPEPPTPTEPILQCPTDRPGVPPVHCDV